MGGRRRLGGKLCRRFDLNLLLKRESRGSSGVGGGGGTCYKSSWVVIFIVSQKSEEILGRHFAMRGSRKSKIWLLGQPCCGKR